MHASGGACRSQRHWISRSWELQVVVTARLVCWDPNSDPPQGRQALLSAELPRQPTLELLLTQAHAGYFLTSDWKSVRSRLAWRGSRKALCAAPGFTLEPAPPGARWGTPAARRVPAEPAHPALLGWPRPVPAGSPAPCRTAGGPAASLGSWSAAAAQCHGICRFSGCSGGCRLRPQSVPRASSSSPDTPGGWENRLAPISSQPRRRPPSRAREGAAPNAWWMTRADPSAQGPRLLPGI